MAAEVPGGGRPSIVDPRSDPRSTAAVVQDAITNVQTIVRKEVELAKIELRQAAADLGTAAGAGGAAAVISAFGLVFLGAAGAKALEQVLAPWAAWLIVASAFFLLAAVAALVARSRANRAPLPPSTTQQSIQENVTWMKQQLRR